MTTQELKQQVRDFIARNFFLADAGSLRDETSLLEEGIIDSTGVLEVIGFIESTFAISVDDAEMLPENLDSIQRISDYVSRKAAPQRLG